MELLIVIPALNEEQSIEGIIQRSLAARRTIIEKTKLERVSVTVVSDGSTDQTVALASRYEPEINLIVFEKNRGYGAAIKEGWSRSEAEFLGFLDADGTCDPEFFATLINALEQQDAEIALGCRLNPESKMPLTRRVGNRIFSIILTLFSSKKVRDTASGMRVIKKSCLKTLFPLPDGLHFTPAMSARAILSKGIDIAEVDMPYQEREGRSKLSVVRDGIRFLNVILKTTFLYRPSRPLTALGLVCLMIAALIMAFPVAHFAMHRSLLEWMIYRFMVAHLLGVVGLSVICFSYLTSRMVNLSMSLESHQGMTGVWFRRFLSHRIFWLVPLLLVASGVALVFPGFVELMTTGHLYEHWSRFIVMSFLLLSSAILVLTRISDYVMTLIEQRLQQRKMLEDVKEDE